MPPTSNDRSQPPAGFMGSNFYPSNNIWAVPTTRDRKTTSRDSDEAPSGSNALNNGIDGLAWDVAPWNAADRSSRPTSTSPNRTRDGGLTNGSTYLDNQHASVGPQRNGFAGNAFQDETNGYNAFGTQRRAEEPSYIDSMPTFAARDSLPPSRHSQGSPAYNDLYHGHTPNNSLYSQRPVNGHANPLQSANQRAFNMNRQLTDEELTLEFARQTLNSGTSGRNTSFNPATQPFQMDAPWAANGASSRLNSVDMTNDAVPGAFPSFRRESVDRASPKPGRPPRRLGQPNGWLNTPASFDTPTIDGSSRGLNQPFNPYTAPYFLPGYTMANGYVMADYLQSIRNPIMQNFNPPAAHSHGVLNQRPHDHDPAKGARSALLEEFRQSKSSRRYELSDIYNHVVEFSGDQHGSRFIQLKLETANSDEKDQVFREIEPNAIQLMKDVFGNYVIQKFFEHGSQVQKKMLAEKMKGKVISLSLQVYACRVVQKALEHILDEQQAELTKELEPEIVKVIKDQNGNHVVQRIIELVPRMHLDFIMRALMGQVHGYATHPYGCRVVQRMLEYGTEEDRESLMRELHKSMGLLLSDQYGNYVAQHILMQGKPEDRTKIIELAIPTTFALSKHKFASNVVEKCIEHGTVDQRIRIRDQILDSNSDGVNTLSILVRDQYGNYVIQKLCEHLEGPERRVFMTVIRPHYEQMKRNANSRQLQALERILGLDDGAEGSSGSEGRRIRQRESIRTDSSVPTPSLTNEPNSPQSSGPPSTNASVGAPVTHEDVKPENGHDMPLLERPLFGGN